MDIFEAKICSFTSQVDNLALVKGSFAEKLREMINEEVDEIKERKRENVMWSYQIFLNNLSMRTMLKPQ